MLVLQNHQFYLYMVFVIDHQMALIRMKIICYVTLFLGYFVATSDGEMLTQRGLELNLGIEF